MNKNPKNHKGVVDSKVSNFKMYKVNKHWVFASALMLSMLGAGMMQTDTATHADSTNEPQVEMMQKSAQKSAEVKADQPAAPVEKAATAASSAAPSSAAPAKEAQSSATNDSAIKDAQSAAPSSAAPAKADNAAAKDEQKAAPASNAAKEEKAAPASNAAKDAQKDDKASSAAPTSNASSAAAKPAADSKAAESNDSSAAQPAAKDSDAKSDADKKVDAPTDQIDTTDVTAGEDGQDLKDDAAAKAAGDVKDNSENKDVNNKKSVDKEKDAKDNNSVGDSPLGDGDLTINGSAVDGLTRNSDGTYSGDLDFHFDASSVDVALFADSNTVIQIPPELRDLFNKINESGSWTRYFNGRGRFKVYIIVVPYVINWELSNSDFSFDGSNLILRNARIAAGAGRRELTIDFNFDLGKAVNDFKADIPDSSNYYHFKSALVDANSIIDWPIIGSAAGEASLSTNQLMPHPDAVDAPTINSIVEGDKTISGKGIPGATVNVSFADGTSIGSTIVDSNGNWTISTGHVDLKGGEVISANQTVDGVTSPNTYQTVESKEDVTAPVINDIMEGDTVITGKGIPGATVDVTFADGSPIGSTIVDSNGNWTISTGHVDLKAGDEITAKQTVDGISSDEAHQTVKAKEDVTAPVINDIMEGDTVITGKGIPGATVDVTFADGTVIGSTVVDSNGNWSVSTSHVNLKAGDEVTAKQTVNGVTSDEAHQTVKANQEVTAPVIDDITEGDKVITGKGIPGAEVTVTFADGTPIGTAIVDSNGNWSVSTAHIDLQAGDEITAKQTVDGVTSDEAHQTVKANQEVTAPVINDITEGDKTITGKGIPGATVNVTFADGTFIGTATVDADGNWSVSTAHICLKAGDELTATQTINGITSKEGNTTVKAKVVVNAPDINKVTAGDRTISGTGKPGATVNVTLDDGTVIGTATVDADGNWTVNVPGAINLKEGNVVTATQIFDGVTSEKSSRPVDPKPVVEAPHINKITEGDPVITGTGIPGAEVTVTLADGTVIGTVTVDKDGNWSVNVGDVELQSGKVVNAVQTVNGVTSKQDSRVVDPKREIDAPVIGHVKEGDRTIRGTGKPGATVTVSFDDGTVIGTTTVDENGKWSVDVPAGVTLTAGDQVVATQTFDGVTSEEGSQTVKAVVDAPEINAVTAGERTITGKGRPGATVNVSLANGIVIGSTTVDENGNWSIDVPEGVNLTDTDVINATQTFDGVTSEQSNRKVDPQQQIDPPNINNVPSDASSITGKGVPGATVTVTLADGTVIGTAVVDDEGNWSVDVPAEITFNVGDEIDATQTLDGVTSDVSHTNVVPKAPSITPPEAGAKVIQGVGDPGATINVYAADGTLIGTTTVDDFGS
ncbi:Ig-like domain-containing protein [Pediococcus acidilactici]